MSHLTLTARSRSPGLSWTQVTLKPGTSCCLARPAASNAQSPVRLFYSSEGGGSFHSLAGAGLGPSRSRNPRHVQSRSDRDPGPGAGYWSGCWMLDLVWVRPTLPWPKPWPGPSLVTGPAAVKLVVKISNHRISAGLADYVIHGIQQWILATPYLSNCLRFD